MRYQYVTVYFLVLIAMVCTNYLEALKKAHTTGSLRCVMYHQKTVIVRANDSYNINVTNNVYVIAQNSGDLKHWQID